MSTPATLGATCASCEELLVLRWGENNWWHERQPNPLHLAIPPAHIYKSKSCPWCSGPKNRDFDICARCQGRMSRGLPPPHRRAPSVRKQEEIDEVKRAEFLMMAGHTHDGSNPDCVWCQSDVAYDSGPAMKDVLH